VYCQSTRLTAVFHGSVLVVSLHSVSPYVASLGLGLGLRLLKTPLPLMMMSYHCSASGCPNGPQIAAVGASSPAAMPSPLACSAPRPPLSQHVLPRPQMEQGWQTGMELPLGGAPAVGPLEARLLEEQW
jgi:hypothetical protein